LGQQIRALFLRSRGRDIGKERLEEYTKDLYYLRQVLVEMQKPYIQN